MYIQMHFYIIYTYYVCIHTLLYKNVLYIYLYLYIIFITESFASVYLEDPDQSLIVEK